MLGVVYRWKMHAADDVTMQQHIKIKGLDGGCAILLGVVDWKNASEVWLCLQPFHGFPGAVVSK